MKISRVLKQLIWSLGFIILISFNSCNKKSHHDDGVLDSNIDSLLSLSQSLILNDYHEAEIHATKAYQLSQLSQYSKGLANSLELLASIENSKGNFNKSLSHIDSAILISKQNELAGFVANHQQLKGFIYFTNSKYDSAYLWYIKALPYFEKQNKKSSLGNLYTKIGRVYYNKLEYDHALKYYQKALMITRESGNEQSIARDLNNIASVYVTQEKYSEALNYFREALVINLKSNRKAWVAINYHNLSKIYSDQNQFDSAIINIDKALSIDRALDNKSNIAEDLYSFGMLYKKMQNYEKSIPYFIESKQLCKETNNLTTLWRVNDALSNSYSKLGFFEEAFREQNEYQTLSDSLNGSGSYRSIIEMELQYKFDLEKSKSSIREQRKIIILLASLGSLLLLALILTILYTKLKLKQKEGIIQQKFLKNKLSNNEAELITNIMQLSEKNESLEQVLVQLKELSINVRQKDQQQVEHIMSNVKQNMNDNIWKEFEMRFKEVNNHFYQSLEAKHSNLTSNESRLCAFLKLNMSSKEIAAITHQSPKSINVARSRLRKKLNITYSDINISQYLNEL